MISLSKGGTVDLSKARPGLTAVRVGLGWDVADEPGREFDLDAVAFLVGTDGKAADEKRLVFYNNLAHGGVTHSGDNRTGAGDGDDETITIDVGAVPADVAAIVVGVSIHQAEARRQSFREVRAATARVLDQGGVELTRYTLSEAASTATAFRLGELARTASGWEFKALGEPVAGGLVGLAAAHGLTVG
jgi:tellurium resistance protein TerD